MIARNAGLFCLALVLALASADRAHADCADRANVFDEKCATTIYQPADAAFRDRYLQPSDKALPANKTAASLSEFNRQVAGLQPGDVLEVDDAIWVDAGYIAIKGAGTAARPVTIRARRGGGVVFEGFVALHLSGSYLRFEGFTFRGRFGSPPRRRTLTTIALGSAKDPCTSCLVDSVFFQDYNPEPASALINLRHQYIASVGQWNRISRSSFDGKHGFGQVLTANKPDRTGTDNTLIDRNYFANIPIGKKNGYETIVVGNSHSWTDSNAIIENNLLYRTQGEAEFISLKSNGVVIRRNTFIQNTRTITLRAADGVVIEANVFVGDGVANTGGVRVYGSNHVIAHNLFQSLGGTDPGNHAISVMAGQRADGPSPAWYKPVSHVVVAFNVFADNKANWIVGGRARQKLADMEPQDVVFGYNDIISASSVAASDVGDGKQVRFAENRCNAAVRATQDICTGPARASLRDGLYLPQDGSPITAADRALYRGLDISPTVLAKMSSVNTSPGRAIDLRRIERSEVGPASWTTAR